MHILQIYTHSPESCPIGNPKNRKTSMNRIKKVTGLAPKHNIKVVGIWTDRWGISPRGCMMHPTWKLLKRSSKNLRTLKKLHLLKLKQEF